MKSKKRILTSVIAAAAAGLLGSTIVAAPASAAGELATANIGSQSAVTISNTWTDVNGDPFALTVTGNFSGHTANGAVLDSIQLCYSGPANSAILVSPYTRNAEGNTWESGPARQMIKGADTPAPCISYTVGKYYEAGSDDVVRVASRITGSTSKLETIAAFYR